MNIKDIILTVLDELEDLHAQDDMIGGRLDYEFRCTAANIASLAGLNDRATWCDMLRNNPASKYHKRYHQKYEV